MAFPWRVGLKNVLRYVSEAGALSTPRAFVLRWPGAAALRKPRDVGR